MRRLRAVVLGATGAAGQNVVEALDGHPWFRLAGVAASKSSSGKRYGDVVKGAWFFQEDPGGEVLDMEVQALEEVEPSCFDLAFSALPSEVAQRVEPRFAKYIPLFSTSSAYRYENDVPILLPDVNPHHSELIKTQQASRGWEGFICPGPNCTTVGLVTTLKPIQQRFGVKSVHMVSQQSLSGAGERGIRVDSDYRRAVEMNILPYIEGEEEKVARETRKILGRVEDGVLVEEELAIGVTCTRVYVERVHFLSVFAETRTPCTVSEVAEALEEYEGEPQRLRLPSAPKKPIKVLWDPHQPQPRTHKHYGGQITLVGRLRKDPIFPSGVSYVATSDNLVKGAGGGAVLSAEYLKAMGYY